MKDLLNELCLWLSHQKGVIPQDYAKDLAKYIAKKENHPVKELTDEEIKQVWNDNLAVMGNDLQFAKAILRKAQEK